MPLYDYKCKRCGRVTSSVAKPEDREVVLSCMEIGDEDYFTCVFERMVSAPHVVVEEHNRAYNKYGRS